MNRLSSTLPLKLFGCTVFVHIHDHNWGKFEPWARKCVHVGYASNKKRYKCFNAISKKNVCHYGCNIFRINTSFHNWFSRKEKKNKDSDQLKYFQLEESPVVYFPHTFSSILESKYYCTIFEQIKFFK